MAETQNKDKRMKVKLGRRPARFTRASILRGRVLARHLSALGPAPTASPDYVSAVMQNVPAGWGMDGNDTYGDCVIADCAHQEMLRTANSGMVFVPTNLQVLALYAYFQGYTGDPNDLNAIQAYLANNDNGCDEATVMQYLESSGWNGRKLDGFANLDPTQLDELRWTVCIFGACRLGVNLPQSAMDQSNAGQPWDYVPGSSCIGGHDVPIVKYDANGTFWVVTWGQLQAVTPAFINAAYTDGTGPYVEEAHAELAFDWVNQAGTAPDGLNIQQLQQDLSTIVSPQPQPPSGPQPQAPRPMLHQMINQIEAACNVALANPNIHAKQFKTQLEQILAPYPS